MLQDCAAFKNARCHDNLGLALQLGQGINRDIVAAWAHYDIARQLSNGRAPLHFAEVDKILTPTEKDNARKLSEEIRAGLQDAPPVITLRRDP